MAYEAFYEQPMLIEIGDFAELTLGFGPEDCVDWYGGDAWFC